MPTETIEGPTPPRFAIVRALARPETATYVYFIQAGERGPIKIGVASNPYTRLDSLQTGNPYLLRLIAAFAGGYPDEARLHREFERERLESEWFRASKRVVAMAAKYPRPTAVEVEQSGGNQWKAAALHNSALAGLVLAAQSEKNSPKPHLCRKERWELVYGPRLQSESPESEALFELARDAVTAVLPPCRPFCKCQG